MALRILAAGGTFDKRYDPIGGTLGFADTHLHEIVTRARLAGPVTVEVAMLIDSLEMTEQHRRLLLERCRVAVEHGIVIVHGTDTMVETAQVLGRAGLDKRIVLTGAMLPYSVAGSDAVFNLGFALGWAAGADPGVWVAMNGVAHAWHDVRKNRERGVFERLSAAGRAAAESASAERATAENRAAENAPAQEAAARTPAGQQPSANQAPSAHGTD